MNLTDTKIADGQPSPAAPETDGADFAALLQPLASQQGATETGAVDTGDTPAQPAADAEFADLEAAAGLPPVALDSATADLEPVPEEALPAPQLAVETTLQDQPGSTSAGLAMSAELNLDDTTLDASGGKSLPPVGNSLQSNSSVPAGAATDQVASAPAQAAAETAPGPAPDPTVQKTLRVDGQMPTRDLPADSVAVSAQPQKPAPATTGLDPRAPLPAAATEQLADDRLPSQGQEFSARMAGASQAAALNTGAPASQATTPAALAAAVADTEAGATFTGITGSEASGRGLPDSPAAERALRLPIQQFAGQPGWGEEIRSNLQWLSRQGLHRAELQLHPAELGSIDVRITTENDQASVVFYAANRTARELLEAELPRLRELFGQAGVELTQADVAERQPDGRELGSGQQGYDGGHNSSIKESATGDDNGNEAVGSLAVDASGAQNLIDYYI